MSIPSTASLKYDSSVDAAEAAGGRRHIPDWVYSVAAIAALLAIWTAVTAGGWVEPDYLPSPLGIMQSFQTLLADGYKDVTLHAHIGASLGRTLAGFVLGALLGIPLGLLTGYSRIGSAMISPLMAFIRPIPPIAFIPMAVLYFGLGELGKIVLIFFTAFNYAQVNAHAGAAGVPIAYHRAAQSLGLTRFQVFFGVVLPAAVPQIFTGLKVAMALSWAVVVAAELVGAQRGLGFMIADAAQMFQIPVVFIGIALIGVIGLLLNFILGWLEKVLVHWNGR
ncbi:NitT/TauT family transport system permease protein [Paucimonas lemoignei]|uniref:NitT/TauT family transport system permease protein n=1 Tax=Paucimonas lemoignei TaxID=29443 RepID=A0A4R3HXF1_PAULE|nr:ABC transporter permease [Paucimonas lemoignei]TCS38007.1 NitT/TauT family transport system permease protein [Paucimonas lemoignei]